MKSYQVHSIEIFMYKTSVQNENLVPVYKILFDELLDPRNISDMEIFESLDFLSSTMTSRPSVTEPMLRKEVLPYLFFLMCSN